MKGRFVTSEACAKAFFNSKSLRFSYIHFNQCNTHDRVDFGVISFQAKQGEIKGFNHSQINIYEERNKKNFFMSAYTVNSFKIRSWLH